MKIAHSQRLESLLAFEFTSHNENVINSELIEIQIPFKLSQKLSPKVVISYA